MKHVIYTIGLSLFILSCTPSEPKEEKKIAAPEVVVEPPVGVKDTDHVTVFVRSNGTMLLNNKPAVFKDLEASFQALKAKDGIVFYSREKTEGYDPPEESIKVVDLVMKYQLALRFYTDSTFSEVVDFK